MERTPVEPTQTVCVCMYRLAETGLSLVSVNVIMLMSHQLSVM